MKLSDGFRFLCLISLLKIGSCVGEDELIAEARSGIADEVKPQQGEEFLKQDVNIQQQEPGSQQQGAGSQQQEAGTQQQDVKSQQQEIGIKKRQDITGLIQEQQAQKEDTANENGSGSDQKGGELSEAVNYSE